MKKIKLLFILGSVLVLAILIVSFYIFSNRPQRPVLGSPYWLGEQELSLDVRLENVELTIIDIENISRSTSNLNLTIVNHSEYLLTFGDEFSIEHYDGNQWLRYSQSGDTRLIDYYDVHPGETLNFNRNFSHFPIDLKYPGLYRIRQTIIFGEDFDSNDLIAEFYVE